MANFFWKVQQMAPLYLGNIAVVENHYKMSHFNSTFWAKKIHSFFVGVSYNEKWDFLYDFQTIWIIHGDCFLQY